MENNEHIDKKDIRIMFENFRKQNINFVEILFTKYKVINPIYEKLLQPLFDNRERIARYNKIVSVKSISGMAMEKYHSLEKPYPSCVEDIEKYGYSPKQLHHIVRLEEFLERYISGENYSDCLVSKNKEYLIDLKRGLLKYDEAKKLAVYCLDKIIKIKDEFLSSYIMEYNKDIEYLLNDILYKIIYHSIELFFKEKNNGIT